MGDFLHWRDAVDNGVESFTTAANASHHVGVVGLHGLPIVLDLGVLQQRQERLANCRVGGDLGAKQSFSCLWRDHGLFAFGARAHFAVVIRGHVDACGRLLLGHAHTGVTEQAGRLAVHHLVARRHRAFGSHHHFDYLLGWLLQRYHTCCILASWNLRCNGCGVRARDG